METRVRPPAWLWFNLLSLDAPLIALLWQDFLSRCYPTALLLTGRAVLGLTVWGIYLADRLLDVRHPPSASETVRHRFYRQHRAFAKTLFAGVATLDLTLTLFWLRPAVFSNGLILSAGVVVYLGAFPFTGWSSTAWKKPVAAVIFTAGIFLIAWTSAGHGLREFALPALAFCALCLLNLIAIERWNRGTESTVAEKSLWVLLPAACFLAAHGSPWFIAIAVSALGLCALTLFGHRISGNARCVLADALLLTPILFR